MTDSQIIKEIPELKTGEEIMVKQKSHLVQPSFENLSKLQEIRNSNIFFRIFHKMSEGSMRGVTFIFMRLCIGVGVLTLPYYMRTYGGLVGALIFVLAAYVNYLMYAFLIDVGNKTGIHDYVILTKRYTSVLVQKLFKFTYLFDLISTVFFTQIIVYNMFEYLLAFTNLPPDDWYQDKQMLKFKTYYGPVFLMRLGYNVVSVLLLLPFLFKPDLGALASLNNNYLVVLIVLCLFIFVEMGFFRMNLQKMPNFNVDYLVAQPSPDWLGSFFGVMLAFYAQQYFFSIRKELMHPTTKRLKKTSMLTMSFLCLLFLLIGKDFTL
jgi:amino acid permease